MKPWGVFLLLAVIFCLCVAGSFVLLLLKINAIMLLIASLGGFLISFLISLMLFINND